MKDLKYVKDLVSIKSFSIEENKQIIEYLKNVFKPVVKEIIALKNEDCDKENLLIGVNCKLKDLNDAIILSGHIDTVVANEDMYNTDPYIATQIEDKIFGLGVIDMKCFFGTILDNLQYLQQAKKPIVVAITSDEETEFQGVKVLTDFMKKRNIKSSFSLIGEPTNMFMCTVGKSVYEYIINVKGISCHSSDPSKGVNANYIVAKLINKIEKLNMSLPNTTLSCNIVKGGEAVNIISPMCMIKFDLRTDSQQKEQIIISKIKQKIAQLKKLYLGCEIELKPSLEILPFNNYETNKYIKEIASTLKLETTEFKGGCEAGFYQSVGGEALVFGCGDLSLAHKPNEYLEIKKYEEYDKYFKQIIKIVDKQKI